MKDEALLEFASSILTVFLEGESESVSYELIVGDSTHQSHRAAQFSATFANSSTISTTTISAF